jgi:retron-type reverse transcriptase
MTKLEQLINLKDLSDFANFLGFKPKTLSYLLYVMPDNEKYESFSIPKKNGGVRIINAPNKKIKLLQKRLSNLLYDCYEDITKNKKGITELAQGFKRKCSIFTNSRKHCKKRYVFNIDLKDFFPSINFGRVRGYFINDKNFKLNEKIATIIAQIACFKNELPQGSPVSPIISNLIGNILDVKILKLSKEAKCYYSRYADDLTFSTTNKSFPKSIAYEKDNRWIVGNELKGIIEKSGFKINETKISMQYRSSRQTCVGLVVNNKVNVKKEYYKNVRAMCNNLFMNNTFYVNKGEENNSIFQLEGMLNFIYFIKRKSDKRKMDARYKNPNAITKLYRKYFIYKYFITTDRPIIFTEGKSDKVYLKCALRNLKENYPDLITMNDDKYCFKINIFKSSKFFRDVFAIAEGTSGLENLMNYYKKEIGYFKHHKLKFPIIIILDNDQGAKEIKKLLEIKDEEVFYKCFNNQMYVLFVDKKGGTAIENLFDDEVCKVNLDGKSFEPDEKKMDKSKNYGKQIFAQKIILPNYNKINFEKFKPIFDNILNIISECKRLDAST